MIVSCTSPERHFPFWRYRTPNPLGEDWSRVWVCWRCHPCPYPVGCYLDTREIGVDMQMGQRMFGVLDEDRVERLIVEWRDRPFPSDGERRVARPDQGAARAAANRAIQQVEAHAPPDWMERAFQAAKHVATIRDEFTTDAIWYLVGAPPEPRAMGAVMRRIQVAGLARPTDRTVESKREECHARPVRVWQSLIP